MTMLLKVYAHHINPFEHFDYWTGSVGLVHSACGFYFKVKQHRAPVSTWMGDRLSTRLRGVPHSLDELSSWPGG